MPEHDLSEFEALTQVEELRRANVTLQAQLRKAKGKSEDYVAAVLEGSRAAMLALGPTPRVPTPKRDGRRRKGEVALWHLTDWQGAKVTTSYDSTVMRERVMRYCDKAEQLTMIQRADHPVRECVILFGGDMGEGLFNFPAQVFEVDATLFDQFARIARLQVDVVRRALALYDKVTVVSEWGNHGRVGSKRAVVPRADNFDRMTYELARALLEGESRLTWEDSEEDVRRVEIGEYRALLMHGDEFGRNGWVAPSTFVSNVAKWQSGAYGWEFRDVYVGHMHVHEEYALPNGRGSVYKTGSPESDNRYAAVGLASASMPSQRLHFIDPVAGHVSAVYKVWLGQVDRDVRLERELVDLAARAASLNGDAGLSAFADARSWPGPVREGPDWDSEAREELADCRNYLCWGVQKVHARMLAGDPRAADEYERRMRALSAVVKAWHELHRDAA